MRALLIMLTILVALTPATAAPALPIPFDTLAEGLQSGILVPTREIVRTDAAWRVLWARHARGADAVQAVPDVDFSRFMIVAVFSGRSSAVGRVRVIRVTREPSRLVVVLHAVSDRPGGAAVFAPFHMVRVPFSRLPVDFVLDASRREPIDPPVELDAR